MIYIQQGSEFMQGIRSVWLKYVLYAKLIKKKTENENAFI